MLEVLLDSLIDSLKVLAVLFVVNVIIAFAESKIQNTLEKSRCWSPAVGGLFGLLPQCGFSVVATDLYQKKHITVGTLIAVYIATSDEALPVFLSRPDRYLELIILLAIKLVLGVAVGFLVDFIFSYSKKTVLQHEEHCEHEEEVHVGCCHHEIEDENKWKRYLLHPILHSLKIFAYVLVINFLFGILMYFVGKDAVTAFLTANKYLAPLIAVIVGLIPNCASSLIITNVYLLNGISFGACVGGLIVNAGLGMLLLFKKKDDVIGNLKILAIMVATALIAGYAICFIAGF